MQTLQFLAEAESHAQSGGLLGALGIDWKLLLLQGAAFLILVWFLGKYVYPILIKAIDDRQAKIEEGTKAAAKAEASAAKAESDLKQLLKEARAQADDIVATAHKEATAMLETAETKAANKAEHIINEARAQLDQDIVKARQALRAETTELVALATEKIIKQKIDSKGDAQLIESALKEAS